MAEGLREKGFEFSPDAFRNYIEKLNQIREVVNQEATDNIEARSNLVREKMGQQGINMETLRDMMDALEQTELEAFSLEEVNQIRTLIDYLLIEWDPTFKPFLQRLKQRLKTIADIKNSRNKK